LLINSHFNVFQVVLHLAELSFKVVQSHAFDHSTVNKLSKVNFKLELSIFQLQVSSKVNLTYVQEKSLVELLFENQTVNIIVSHGRCCSKGVQVISSVAGVIESGDLSAKEKLVIVIGFFIISLFHSLNH